MSQMDTQRLEDDDRVRKSPDSLSGGGSSSINDVHDSGRGSSEPSPAPGGLQQQLTLPLMTNRPPSVTNRPPSAASTHSAASNGVVSTGGPRLTTTSRRGGRARSRSPVSNVGRPGSRTSNREDFMGAPAEAFPPSAPDVRNSSHIPPAPANPSSAAAAAAAAAKALSNSRGAGRGPRSSWYDDGQGGHRGDGRGENPRYRPPGGYENAFLGSRNWPAEEGVEDRRGYSPKNSLVQDRPPADGFHQSGRGPFERYEDRPDFNSGRYGDPRSRGPFDQEGGRNGGPSTSRLTPPLPPCQYDSDRHRPGSRNFGGENRDDYYQGPGGMAPVNDGAKSDEVKPIMFQPDKPSANRTSPKPGQAREGDPSPGVKRNRGTSRVIGTPTPIHVPRAAEAPTSARQPGTPASVFRGRPSGDTGGPPGADEDDDSPQKILLSLRTPTTSFEERDSNAPKGHKGAQGQGAQPPLSPEEPPQIQHAHNQNQMDTTLFFEPQRSPKQQGGTIEMAPSFSLFNQSFDSLGDSPAYLNVGAPLDATFNSSSFGAGPSPSNEMEGSGPQFLPSPGIHRNMSGVGGSFGAAYPPSQPLLGGGSSSGGMMTFGMSPVDSFGNGAPIGSGRRENMMLLGGSDARSTSPTQMLSMYPSYSGGYGGNPPPGQSPPFRTGGHMGENHMRSMSSGSFGGASLLHAYTPRSFGAEGSPHANYHTVHSPEAARGQEGYHGPPGFYVFLRRHKGAFIKCSFLLPGLKAALLESPLTDTKKGPDSGEKDGQGRMNKRGQKPPPMPIHLGLRPGRGYPDPSPHETAIAMRRVVCAVCAFGGGPTNNERTVTPPSPQVGSSQSIFREKESEKTDKTSPTTVTPSSTMGTPPGTRESSRAKAKYDEMLPGRYYENENRLSWEFEESPPVGSPSDDEGERGNSKNKRNGDGGKDGKDASGSNRGKSSLDSEGGDDTRSQDGSTAGSVSQSSKTNSESGKKGPDQPKMRYRCKLCGLPKQNHTCAYQQSLQRSIGVMIYPAVNAFTASEPGVLAPPLEDMNNFVLGGGESVSSADGSPSRPTPDRKRHTADGMSGTGSTQVTPDTLRSALAQTASPGSSLSTGTTTPLGTPYRTPKLKRDPGSQQGDSGSKGGPLMKRSAGGSPPGSGKRPKRPRHLASGDETDLLFVEAMEIKQEQFRIISPSKNAQLPDAYTYPSLPLPYAQRKRLSDNLFALSKEVPQLTDECAVVLREAREKDMWDLAVAELMTQVVVIIHCHDGDSRFEGLRQYLMTLGIAC